MSKPEISFLSEDGIERMHKASLRILKETGVKVHSEKVRRLLAENGAEVNDAIVKIPSSLVEEAINRAPEKITMGAREPKCGFEVPSNDSPFLATSGFCPFVDDFETGEKRKSTSSDLKDFAIISDYLDSVDYFWPIVFPGELPPPLQELHALVISLENIRKHIQCSCVTEKTAKWQIRLASAIVGGEEELRKRPIFSAINDPVSPLTFERGSAEAMVTLARAGIPIGPASGVTAAMTGPATIAGALAVATAEGLASLVIIECANPGAPMIYRSTAGTLNRKDAGKLARKNGKSYYGAHEGPFLSAAGAQMARFYKLPSSVAGVGTGGIPSDDLLSFERNILKIAMRFMCRTDLVPGLGSRGRGSVSLDGLILGAEVSEHARAYLRRFEVNDDTLALDVIHKVGPGGHFLGEKHTRVHFRKEIWSRELCDTFILSSVAKGSFLERARTKVKEILSTHKPPPIKEDVHKEMGRILRDAKKDILGDS